MGVLRQWFGPSKAELWHQLSEQVGGQYDKGSFLKTDKVTANHGDWPITLDTFVVSTGKTTIPFTRIRAPYVNPDGFRFTVYRRGVFSDVGKLFGMQDVEVGYPTFDRDFVIKGNDESKLRTLFANSEIRRLLDAQPSIKFEVRDDDGCFGAKFPDGVDELYFVITGVLKDVDRLELLFELFAETLDELCRMGSAYEGGDLPIVK